MCRRLGHSAAISACAADGLWQLAFHLKQSIRAMAVKLNTIALNTCLDCCGKARNWEWTLDALKSMKTLTIEPTQESLSILLSATNAKAWTLAVDDIAQSEPDLHLLNCAIHSVAACWRLAYDKLVWMTRQRLSDKTSFSTAMTACEKAGEWTTSLALFNSVCYLHTSDHISYLDVHAKMVALILLISLVLSLMCLGPLSLAVFREVSALQ